MYYWTCPDCGANLDPGESCDCGANLDPGETCDCQNNKTEVIENVKSNDSRNTGN